MNFGAGPTTSGTGNQQAHLGANLKAARDDVVVGLDIGTTKVCAVVGSADANGRLNILGVGVVPSRGLKKGVVIDVEDTVTAIRDALERARHMAGIELTQAVAGVTGDHIQSSNRRGTVTVAGPEGTITPDDVARVLQAAALDVPRDREIIHSLPRDFSVDGHKGVRRPIGMCGSRLEVETHVVTGQASFLQNVVQCVERAGLQVESLVLEPIATSEAVTTSDERELGVALIDIGGGTSDIAVFTDGSISFSDVLSVGGTHVTRDISIGLRTPLEIAERLKIERGVASPSLIPHGEALEVITAGSGERLRLPRSVLGEIIEARMTELFEMARERLWSANVQKRLPAGIILTGGGALLPGAVELASQVFEMPVRLGRPIDLSGWSEQVEEPQFATAVGLLRFAARQRAAIAMTSTAGAATNEAARRAPSRPTTPPANLSNVPVAASPAPTLPTDADVPRFSPPNTAPSLSTSSAPAPVASTQSGDAEAGSAQAGSAQDAAPTPFDRLAGTPSANKPAPNATNNGAAPARAANVVADALMKDAPMSDSPFKARAPQTPEEAERAERERLARADQESREAKNNRQRHPVLKQADAASADAPGAATPDSWWRKLLRTLRGLAGSGQS